MAALCMNTFVGLRAAPAAKQVAVAPAPSVKAVSLAPRASLEKTIKSTLVASTAGLLLAGSAMAAEISAGTVNGELIFKPNKLEVATGEKIVFKVAGGQPHNVVFTDGPAGVDLDGISSDLLNAVGETFEVTLSKPGTYSYYCEPHGTGMSGDIIVK